MIPTVPDCVVISSANSRQVLHRPAPVEVVHAAGRDLGHGVGDRTSAGHLGYQFG